MFIQKLNVAFCSKVMGPVVHLPERPLLGFKARYLLIDVDGLLSDVCWLNVLVRLIMKVEESIHERCGIKWGLGHVKKKPIPI